MRRLSLFLALLAPLMLGACHPTEVLLVVNTDGKLVIPDDIDHLAYDVLGQTNAVPLCKPGEQPTGTPPSCFTFPMSILFVPGAGGVDSEAKVTISALKNEGPVLSSVAKFRFVKGSTLSVYMTLYANCKNRLDCAANGQACVDGQCMTLSVVNGAPDLAQPADDLSVAPDDMCLGACPLVNNFCGTICGRLCDSCGPGSQCLPSALACSPCNSVDGKPCCNGGCDNGLVCDQSSQVCRMPTIVCGSADQACCPALAMQCHKGLNCAGNASTDGICTPCGMPGLPCCTGTWNTEKCGPSLSCQKDNTCQPSPSWDMAASVTDLATPISDMAQPSWDMAHIVLADMPPPCGTAGLMCCAGFCSDGSTCTSGICRQPPPCGGDSAPCCGGVGGTCQNQGLACDANGYCRQCGVICGGPCCPGKACDPTQGLTCDTTNDTCQLKSGPATCLPPPPPPPPARPIR